MPFYRNAFLVGSLVVAFPHPAFAGTVGYNRLDPGVVDEPAPSHVSSGPKEKRESLARLPRFIPQLGCPAILKEAVTSQEGAGFWANLLGIGDVVNPEGCINALGKIFPKAEDLEFVLAENPHSAMGYEPGTLAQCVDSLFPGDEERKKKLLSMLYALKRPMRDDALASMETIASINGLLGEAALNGMPAPHPLIPGASDFQVELKMQCRPHADALSRMVATTRTAIKRLGMIAFERNEKILAHTGMFRWQGNTDAERSANAKRFYELRDEEEEIRKLVPWIQTGELRVYAEKFINRHHHWYGPLGYNPGPSFRKNSGLLNPREIEADLDANLEKTFRQDLINRRNDLAARINKEGQAMDCMNGPSSGDCYEKVVKPLAEKLPPFDVTRLARASRSQSPEMGKKTIAAAASLDNAGCRMDVAKTRDEFAKVAGEAVVNATIDLALVMSGVGAPYAGERMLARTGMRAAMAVRAAETANTAVRVSRRALAVRSAVWLVQGANLVRNGYNVYEACNKELDNALVGAPNKLSNEDLPACANVTDPSHLQAQNDYRDCLMQVAIAATDAVSAATLARRAFAGKKLLQESEEALRSGTHSALRGEARETAHVLSVEEKQGAILAKLEPVKIPVGTVRSTAARKADELVAKEIVGEMSQIFPVSRLDPDAAARLINSLDANGREGLLHALRSGRAEVQEALKLHPTADLEDLLEAALGKELNSVKRSLPKGESLLSPRQMLDCMMSVAPSK